MARWTKRPWGWVAAWVLVVCLGCNRSETPQEKSKPGGPNTAAGGEAQEGTPSDASATAKGKPKEPPPPPPTIPKVTMSETDRATCRTGEGEPLPDGELPDLDGKRQSLRALFGKRLTVVVVWDSKNIYALEELGDLDADVDKPYRDKGVQVIGVNVGETPQVVRDKLKLTGAAFPTLLDADGAYFAKLATERLPRTYLLDAEGKILWFDIEYSRHTRRSLMQGIKVALGELK